MISEKFSRLYSKKILTKPEVISDIQRSDIKY